VCPATAAAAAAAAAEAEAAEVKATVKAVTPVTQACYDVHMFQFQFVFLSVQLAC
jgi:hypothetical protein